MNFIKSYLLGKTCISVNCNKEMHKKIGFFCLKAENISNFITITINVVETKEDILSINYLENIKSEHTLKEFKLLNINYYYDNCKNMYYACNDFCFGKILIKEHSVEWYIVSEVFPPRALFHVSILDPYSLFCTEINEIVFHGAALEKEGVAYALLGNSKNGKSTLSYNLSKESNINKICDDTFIIAVSEEQISLFPINTGSGYSLEVAQKLLQLDGNYEMYTYNDKIYLMQERVCQNREEYNIDTCFMLKRTISDTCVNKTESTILNANEFLKEIINTQTNIGSCFLAKKFNLYKILCLRLKCIKVNYINDCEISIISENMRSSYV